MHPKEFKKVRIATGRLTHLQLTNSEILVDIDFTNHRRLNDLIETHNTFVLYPNQKSLNLSCIDERRPSQLKGNNLIIVIDATWYLAKKMFKLSENLHQLPSVSFEHNQTSNFKIKQQPFPKCLSTIESVKIVIQEFNRLEVENCDLDNFLNPFHKMVEYQINCQENPPENSYRSGTGTSLVEKKKYRSSKARNLFFNFN